MKIQASTFKDLCFAASILLIASLFPTPDKLSDGFLYQINQSANRASAVISGYGFSVTDNGNAVRTAKIINGTTVVFSFAPEDGMHHQSQLTFNFDNIMLIGIKVCLILVFGLLIYPAKRTGILTRLALFALGCITFGTLFALRDFAFGFLLCKIELHQIVSLLDGPVRYLLGASPLLPLCLYLHKTRKGPSRPAPEKVRPFAWILLCFLAGCGGDFSNSSINISIGGGHDTLFFIATAFILPLWNSYLNRRQGDNKEDQKDAREEKADDKTKRSIARSGFTQQQIADYFRVTPKEVSRWDNGEIAAPAGYSRELRLSGDVKRLEKVLADYGALKRSKGADVYAKGLVVHTDSEAFIHRKSL